MNVAHWFELPVKDFQRAVQFYESVFDVNLKLMNLQELKMALFPSDKNGSGSSGALVFNPQHYQPNDNGILIYLKTSDIDKSLKMVEENGGSIISGKVEISSDFGSRAIVIDSEGNRIALLQKA